LQPTSTFFPYTTLFRSSDCWPPGQVYYCRCRTPAELALVLCLREYRNAPSRRWQCLCSGQCSRVPTCWYRQPAVPYGCPETYVQDRKSTRLNSSHVKIS